MSIEEKDKIPNLVCRPVVLYISSFRLSWKPLSRTAFGGISTAANCKVVLHLQRSDLPDQASWGMTKRLQITSAGGPSGIEVIILIEYNMVDI